MFSATQALKCNVSADANDTSGHANGEPSLPSLLSTHPIGPQTPARSRHQSPKFTSPYGYPVPTPYGHPYLSAPYGPWAHLAAPPPVLFDFSTSNPSRTSRPGPSRHGKRAWDVRSSSPIPVGEEMTLHDFCEKYKFSEHIHEALMAMQFTPGDKLETVPDVEWEEVGLKVLSQQRIIKANRAYIRDKAEML